MALALSRINSVTKEDGVLFRSDKLNIKLYPLGPSEAAIDRPFRKEKNNYIKLSFRSGGQSEFYNHLNSALQAKTWTIVARAPVKREIRAGITGIEKNINQRARQVEKHELFAKLSVKIICFMIKGVQVYFFYK